MKHNVPIEVRAKINELKATVVASLRTGNKARKDLAALCGIEERAVLWPEGRGCGWPLMRLLGDALKELKRDNTINFLRPEWTLVSPE